jgi:hypothetical protein
MGIPTSAFTLSWSAAGGATDYRVYYGTDQAMVTSKDASVDQGLTGGATSFNTGTRTANTQYFWRITAINAAGSTDSPVFSFRTQ